MSEPIETRDAADTSARPHAGKLPHQSPLFVWMTSWLLLGCFFLALYVVPHLALGTELSTNMTSVL